MHIFQVLFRYAIAIFKFMETTLIKQGDYMSIYNTLRDGLEYLTDTQSLTQVSITFSKKGHLLVKMSNVHI